MGSAIGEGANPGSHLESRTSGLGDAGSDLLSRIADAVVVISGDGIVEDASGAIDAMFGWPAADLVGQPIGVLMGAADGAAHQSYVERYRRTGKSGILNAAPRTLTGRHRSGSAVEFELTIGEAVVDGRQKFIGVCRDASARLQAERALRDAGEKLQSQVVELQQLRASLIAEQTRTLDLLKAESAARAYEKAATFRLEMAASMAEVHVWELDYRARTIVKAGAEDTFFDRPVSFGRMVMDPFSTVHPDDRELAIAAWSRYLATGQRETVEYRTNRADGVEVWASSTTEQILDETGAPARLVGALQNITARKRNEAALVDALRRAELAARAKGEFLANMSHEIRTPLNGVMGVAAALARTELNPIQTEMVELINASGQTLETLLGDVLDLARIDSGRLELRLEPFCLSACLNSTAALFRPGASAKGLDLQVAIAPDLTGALVGDPVRIRQIIGNLLSNAVKFTEAGLIGLEAGRLADGRIFMTVSDTGIGFNAEVHGRLFQRFEQADSSITRRFGGTGLGLSIARALAEAMGGALSARSEPGVGSQFTLTIALEQTSRALNPLPRPKEPPGESERPVRVLLAEDHPINRKVVELLLDGACVDLTCVENGAEALAAVTNGSFDLVLMDMQMPVMDGLAAIRAIRDLEASTGRPRTPINTLSANALPEHAQAAREAGADGHITKPVGAARLFEAIDQALASRPITLTEAIGA